MPLQLSYYKTELPFEYPFTISGGRTKTHQQALQVMLGFGKFTGHGEAPAITYYNISVEQMITELQHKKKAVESFAYTEPARFWHFLYHLFPGNPFLACALDIASWDLYGQLKNKPLYKLWNTEWNAHTQPLTDYTIGIDSTDIMVGKMKDHPWPVYKIKLGNKNDINIMKALRAETNAIFRTDANAGWSAEEAMHKIPELQNLGVELIEQPLAKDNIDGMKDLYHRFSIPLIADESCVTENDVEKCNTVFNGINIKLTKCGGITPALRMIEKARKLNMKVMMGSMNESTIGSVAIAHFLPQLDYVDMDGPLLLKEDIATGLTYKNGVVDITHKPGLGVVLTDAAEKHI